MIRIFYRDKNKEIIPNIYGHEILCHCGNHSIDDYEEINEIFLDRLYIVRNLKFKRPMKFTSIVRCKKHNASVGGVHNSYHLRGMAADVIDPNDIYESAALFAYLNEWFSFVKRGVSNNTKYIHFDIGRFKWIKQLYAI